MAAPGEGITPAIDPTDQAGPIVDPADRFAGPFTPELVDDLQATMLRVADGARTGAQPPDDLAALDKLAAGVRTETVYIEDGSAASDSDEVVMGPQTLFFRTTTGQDGKPREEELNPTVGQALLDYRRQWSPQDNTETGSSTPSGWTAPKPVGTEPPRGTARTGSGRPTNSKKHAPPTGSGNPKPSTSGASAPETKTSGDGYDGVRDLLTRRHPGKGKPSLLTREEEGELDALAGCVTRTEKTAPSGAPYAEYTLVETDASGNVTETVLPKDVGARLYGHNEAGKKAAEAAAKKGGEQTEPTKPEPAQDSPKASERKKTPEVRKLNHPLRSVAKERTPRGEDRHIDERGLYAVFGGLSETSNAQNATRQAEKAIRDFYAQEEGQPESPAEAAARMKAAFMHTQETLPRDGSGGVSSATVAKVEHIEGKDYLITGSIGNSPIMLWRNGQLTPIGKTQETGTYMADGFGHPHHVDGNEGGFFSVELQPGDMVLLASGGTLSDKQKDRDARSMNLPSQLLREYGDVFTVAALGNGSDAKSAERAAELCCTLGRTGADKSAILLQYGEVMKPRPLDIRSGQGRTFRRTRESFSRTDFSPHAFSGADDARGIYSAYNLLKNADVRSGRSPAEAAQQRARLYLENQPQPRTIEDAMTQLHEAMQRSANATALHGERNDAEGVLTRIIEVNGKPHLVAARAGHGMAAVYRDGTLADAFEGDDLVAHVTRNGHEIAVRALERGDKILITSAGIFGDGDVPRDDAATRRYSENNVSIRDILETEGDPREAAQRFIEEYGQEGRNPDTGAPGRNFREKAAVVIQVGQPDPFATNAERLTPAGPGSTNPALRGPGLLRPTHRADQEASLEAGQEVVGAYIEDDEDVALRGLGKAVHWLRDKRARTARKQATKRSRHASVLPGATPNNNNRKKRP
ncbi:hypothetical protein IPP75_04130 [Candidatus Saccharibacteria bacterium]|nr:MAG: hypothetical protein IPP75_04130 [Candidatus Saccharibacteria bacterium]